MIINFTFVFYKYICCMSHSVMPCSTPIQLVGQAGGGHMKDSYDYNYDYDYGCC
jgi:hypothetical protein